MSFYNIWNEEVSQEGILEDLISYYQTLGEAGKTRVDDFHEGSEVRTLLEVLSHLAYNILEEQNNTLSNHFINTAEGEYLDLLGANPNVNLPRIQGTTSTGLVKFSIPMTAVEEMIIPADTVVSTDEVEFVTLEEGVISIGTDYTYVPVECTVEGIDGNISIGAITNCELQDYTVINTEAFTGGSDFEEDEEYRTRLLEYVREDNFGSRGWYENQILSISGVHDITVNPNGTASIDYYVNTNNSLINNTVYNELITFFHDNNNLVVGHDSNFTLATLTDVDLTVTVNADCGYAEEDIIDFFTCYFKGGDLKNYPISFTGLNMGESTTNSALQLLLKDYLTDITNVTITSNISNVTTYGAYNLNSVTVVYS